MKKMTSYVCAAAVVGLTTAGLAITGGTDSPDSAAENANVFVQGAGGGVEADRLTGSGVLLAPDLFVTNGHVVHVPLPPEDPRFSITDGVYPDRWYDIPAGLKVWASVGPNRFGPREVGADGRGPTSRTRLKLDDINGGFLKHNDTLRLSTSNGWFLYVAGGRLGGRVAIDIGDGEGDTSALRILQVEKVTPGEPEIATGQVIALKTRDGSYLAPQSAAFPKLEATAGPRSRKHEFNVYRIGSQTGYVRNYDEIILIASVESGRGWVQYPFVQWGRQIALPGAEDVALIRLAGAVPADAAVPVRVTNHLPRGVDSHADFYEGKTMKVAGYGQMEPERRPRRQQGFFHEATTYDGPSVFCASGVAGETIRDGDSGSGWRVDGSLVGITQGPCGEGTGRFISTLSPGGVAADGFSKPDLTAWYALHLDQDDCSAITAADREANPIYELTGATEVCRFGGPDPYALALLGGAVAGPHCTDFDATRLDLRRHPDGVSEWALIEWLDPAVNRVLMQVPGTWQQSYTRGAYLIDFAVRRGMRQLCVDRPDDPSLIYFR